MTEGTAQPLKVTFISVSFGKACSENVRGKGEGAEKGEEGRDEKS